MAFAQRAYGFLSSSVEGASLVAGIKGGGGGLRLAIRLELKNWDSSSKHRDPDRHTHH